VDDQNDHAKAWDMDAKEDIDSPVPR